jgi:serine/threonine protein kinase
VVLVWAAAGDDVAMDGVAESSVEHREDTLEGTAVYLAPEVVKGSSTSVASDCWALGCVIYQCLTGRPPVWAESQPEIVDKIVVRAGGFIPEKVVVV